MDKTVKIFVTQVRARMDQLGINQAELARRLGKPASNVSHYLKGERNPGIELVKEYAVALECDPSFLVGDTQSSNLPTREPTSTELLDRIIQRWDIDPKRKAVLQAVLLAPDTEVDSLAKLLKTSIAAATKNKDKLSSG